MNYTKSNVSEIAASRQVGFDAGLRAYMMFVSNYMALALLMTGLIAMYVASSQEMMSAFMGSALGWVAIFAPDGVAMFMSLRFSKLSFQAARMCLFVYAGLLGISPAMICSAYTGTSIARVFFISASLFGGISIYGYTTKRDLTNFGSFLMMGLFGIMKSEGLYYITSFIGVIVFTGLTAYDVRKIKDAYYVFRGAAGADVSKVAVFGALNLYMDFINLFISLLRIMGDKKS